MRPYVLYVLSLLFTRAIIASQQDNKPLNTAVDEQQATLELVENFRKPKSIMFSVMMGGSSHCVWVLSILQELSERGHTITFYTRDDHIQFSQQYPSIHTLSSGPSFYPLGKGTDKLLNEIRDIPIIDSVAALFKKTTIAYKEDYSRILELLTSRNIDIAICDHLNLACIEAANRLRLPLVITSSMPQGPGATAPYINSDFLNMHNPTTKSVPFFERLDNMIIHPLLLHTKLWFYLQSQNITIAPTFISKSKWIEAVKIVNTAFGFEQGRPLGPMTELVGPIMPTKYPGLTSLLDDFLSRHKRVAYVAFGQLAIFSRHDVELIMTGLLEAYEAKEIDGFIWATRGNEDAFPRHLVTSSDTTYNIHKFLIQQEDLFFINWAPQMAILSHPSTCLFITHGGSVSLYESFYAGVPVVVYPFFGDQPTAAVTTEKNGAGLYLRYENTVEEAIQIIRRVARDENKHFQNNVNRFKALVQIKSKHSVQRAADVVEEVLFMNQNGEVPHRWDVRRELSFIKANNLDIYAFLMAVGAMALYGSVGFVSYLNGLKANRSKSGIKI